MSKVENTQSKTSKKRFTYTEEDHRTGRSLPLGLWLVSKCFGVSFYKRNKIAVLGSMLFLTFICYMSYHTSRKAFSVTKPTLKGSGQNCTNCSQGYAPFNTPSNKTTFAILDGVQQFTYAVAMYGTGPLADKTSHKWVMTIGCFLTGLMTILFGLANYIGITHLAYFICIQILSGAFGSMGFNCATSIVQKFFKGFGYRSVVFGLWNANPFVGNIVGNQVASLFFTKNWGLSLIVPGLITIGTSVIVGLFLIPSPEIVGFTDFEAEAEAQKHNDDDDDEQSKPLLRESNDESVAVEAKALEAAEENNKEGEEAKQEKMNFFRLLLLPGVLEYSFSLFFGKMVVYVFFFWTPLYIADIDIGNYTQTAATAAFLSSVMDVGQILGGFGSGFLSDMIGLPGTVCVVMQILCCVVLYLFQLYAHLSITNMIVMLLLTGFFVNAGPALISTSVSANLSNNKKIKSVKGAMATVSSIINATGSVGSALGPFALGKIVEKYSWKYLIPCIIVAVGLSTISLARQFYNEARTIPQRIRDRKARRAAAH